MFKNTSWKLVNVFEIEDDAEECKRITEYSHKVRRRENILNITKCSFYTNEFSTDEQGG